MTAPANKDWLDQCLEDLKAHAGKGLVIAGYRQPQAVHELVNLINEKLGNLGHAVEIHVSDTPLVHGNLHDLKDDLGNLDRIIKGARMSLDYAAANFSPYQHKVLRIVEFPRYAQFAQSYPNTIPFSEEDLVVILSVAGSPTVVLRFCRSC